jgi:membrane protein DedA with SNARE-associated domain
VQEFILTHGSYVAIIVILAGSGVGLPLPEEVPVVAAGVLSSGASRELDPTLAFLSCMIGAVTGDSVMYAIGRFLGSSRLRDHPWVASLLHQERVEQMERLIDSHGLKVFFLARFLVGVRSPIYLAAGVLRVRYRWFLAVDTCCAAIVVGGFFWLSYFGGAWFAPYVHNSQVALTLVAILVVIFVAAYVLLIRRIKRRFDPDPTSSPPSV